MDKVVPSADIANLEGFSALINGIGCAMDFVHSAKRVVTLMKHLAKDG